MSLPLVLLTRPHADRFVAEVSAALADAACVRGEPVTRTIIDEAALEHARRRLAEGPAWLVVTSPRTPRLLFERGILPKPETRVAAVGAASARAAGMLTEHVALVGEGDAEALAQKLLATPASSVLIPGSVSSRPALTQALRSGGWRVETVGIYDSLPLAKLPSVYHRADWIVATAGSRVAALHSLGAWDGAHPGLVVLGAPSARVAHGLGIADILCARTPTPQGVAETLLPRVNPVNHLRSGRKDHEQ